MFLFKSAKIRVYYTGMKKYLILLVLVVLGLFILINPFKDASNNKNTLPRPNEVAKRVPEEKESTASIANPASVFCEENGGSLEIVTSADGSQFALCNFDNYSCEEWAYFNGACTVDQDAQKIKKALIAKGLNLTGMKVEIKNHFGKYIGGYVVPISEPAGGGYVFAVKENNDIKVVADGNGVIMCESLKDYPDFPSYLISNCVDEAGNSSAR